MKTFTVTDNLFVLRPLHYIYITLRLKESQAQYVDHLVSQLGVNFGTKNAGC